MSYIQNLYTSRDNNAQGNTFVGQEGRLWWNPDTNAFYYSDGNTVGGLPVAIGDIANANIDNLTVNTIGTDDSSAVEFRTDVYFSQGATIDVGAEVLGSMTVTGDLTITGNISPASNVKIGGIVAGPGVVIGNTGILTIDSANLPVSFGNFFANNNILTMINVNEDMILETSGNAEIQMIGNIGFYKSNGGGVPEPSALFFFARDDGQITIIVPAEDPLLGAVEIIGSSTGNLITPGQAGAMLHITGNPNVPARIYLDGNDDYASFVARRFNGNVAVPTQVLANEDVFRINATAATNAGMPNVAMAQMQFQALENQTTTAQGSTLNFLVTPIGSPASARVEVANITVANGIQATKFTTAGTVSATGNITGGNITTVGLVTATGNVTAGNITTVGLISATGNVTAGNITTVGLVTATGNITGGNISATNHTGTTVSVTGNVTGGNITTVGLVTATGNITGGNILTTGLISATGNITAGNVSGTLLTGTLTTAAQPNVTSVGTLSTLIVTANVSGGNLTTGAQVVATGNITGGNILTSGILSATANVTGGNILTAGLISATGNVTGGNILDSKGDVRSIPVNTKNTGYTLEATDAGKVINMTTGNVTVPAGVFATPFGQAITIYNDQNASNAIVQGSGVTMRLAGTTATGNRTLAHYGLATVVCVAANTFVISGAGLT